MVRRVLSFAAVALLLTGCLNNADQKKVDDAVQTFFAQMKARQYDAMWAAADTDITTTSTKDAMAAYLDRVDAAMGACQAPVKQPSIKFNSTPGLYLQTQEWTEACANGTLYLKISVALRNGVARIAGVQTSDKPIPETNSTSGGDDTGSSSDGNAAPAPASNAS